MFVKPAPGLTFRDPRTRQRFPAEGREVPEDVFWHQMLRQGDVVLATPPPPEPDEAPGHKA